MCPMSVSVVHLHTSSSSSPRSKTVAGKDTKLVVGSPVRRLEAQVREGQKRVAALERELLGEKNARETMAEELSGARTDGENRLRSERERARAEVEGLQNRLVRTAEEFRTQKEGFERQITEKERQMTEKERQWRAERERAEKQLVEREKRETTERERWEKQLAERDRQLTEKDQKAEALQKQLAERDRQLTERDQKAEALQKQLAEKERRAASAMDAMEKRLEDKERLAAEADKRLQRELHALTAQRDKLVLDLEAAVRRNGRLQEESEFEVAENKRLIAELSQESSRLQRLRDELEVDHRENERACEDLEKRLGERGSQLAAALAERDALIEQGMKQAIEFSRFRCGDDDLSSRPDIDVVLRQRIVRKPGSRERPPLESASRGSPGFFKLVSLDP